MPNRNNQPLPLLKTLKVPCAFVPSSLSVSDHFAYNLTSALFAMHRTRCDGCHPASLCLTCSKMVVHIAPTIAPSSNTARTRTTSPFGPRSWTSCTNGCSAVSSPVAPTAYRSVTTFAWSVLGALGGVRYGSPRGSSFHVGTAAVGAISGAWAARSPSMPAAHPLFPARTRSRLGSRRLLPRLPR